MGVENFVRLTLLLTEISQFKKCKLKSSFFDSQPFNLTKTISLRILFI